MAHPHADGGMVLPAVLGNHQSPEGLQRLDTLLAKPGGVQCCGALPEIGIRKEGLHPFSLTACGGCANCSARRHTRGIRAAALNRNGAAE